MYGNQAILRTLSHSRPVIQTKLTVNKPGDEYEQEADRVADQVMRMTAPVSIQRKCSSRAEEEKLQRKCAECEEEEKKIHRKESNTPKPIRALSVMRIADPVPSISVAPQRISRACAACREEDQKMLRETSAGAGKLPGEVPPIAQAVLQSLGRPLDASTRAFFEPRFGHDFSQVRVHADGKAADAARAVWARAYTFGSDIVFGAGEYTPATEQGKRLLAHELAHVVQQGTARPAVGQPRALDGTTALTLRPASDPAGDRRIYREPTPEICSKPTGLQGFDNIRNITRERLRAQGYVFCGPDPVMDPKGTGTWERWVHPTKGLLHLKVKFEDKCPQEDFCLGQSKDLESCFQCCDKAVSGEDESCRKTCDFACVHKYVPPGAE